ncbi:GNAT family N-acetyltransferase [Pseudoduganella sp. DS3]|uniref:GNAT family N-acetyltransferase n=1 Tax=Pseudoduganella guangdongensis TaxID=2692179 RepID=A0A6N9HKH2_9BURK|nr:bifunctional acetate--CoA ligase family protein/GNAT family N-acetyltransferase [Pseudoduganella guangdongensis]MYN03225.1 GNAT family N-acetyltransferase [Pseudoduganella guangdongensis]
MSIRNLEYLFQPRSVALVGASERPHSVGATVLANLLQGGFAGAIMPVNPKYRTLGGRPVAPSVRELPQVPDLAVICTPPATVPGLVAELGELGCRAVVVITAGLDAALKQAMLAAARRHMVRILGPNCVGLLVPGIGLNASFAHLPALPGKLAFVSQSGAMVTGVLDWARSRGIGFSRFISMGDSSDVDFGDVLDYLADDGATQAVLLYVEDVRAARKFMSAARAAARSKPVLVVKSGRFAEGARAAASHTGALAGSDAVYDAAFRRAGMLRVLTTEELFAAVETLAGGKPLAGERMAILTNGGGPGVLATDALVGAGGTLATLAPHTMRRLEEVLPATWSRGNPVDIIGDAPGTRYSQALQALLQDEGVDAVLVLHAPTAIVPPLEAAQAVADTARGAARNVLACWLGGEGMVPARSVLGTAGIANYATPEEAVAGFMQMVNYRRAQQALMEVPAASSGEWRRDRERARAIIGAALQRGGGLLGEAEAKEVLACYGVPVVETAIADRVEAAVLLAERIGFPVALKILSPDINHKSDVGGVVLDLESAPAVRTAALAMRERLHALLPQAHLRGFTVQAMARRPGAHELIVGASSDPVFGPVILFGQGGVAVETVADRALALPPLNMALARDLIGRTRVARLLAGYRGRPAADVAAVAQVLLRISTLLADLPEVQELDINPLLADAQGVLALDARMSVAPAASAGAARFAIRPYPEELEESAAWDGGSVLLRPIRPEDAPQHAAFFAALTPEDVRFRLFEHMPTLPPAQLARWTQIDYEREMAFIATRSGPNGPETLGVARAVADPDNVGAEFAIIVRSDLKGRGLGALLLEKLLRYCRARGLQEVLGEALPENSRMLQLAHQLGFEVGQSAQQGSMRLRLHLAPAAR